MEQQKDSVIATNHLTAEEVKVLMRLHPEMFLGLAVSTDGSVVVEYQLKVPGGLSLQERLEKDIRSAGFPVTPCQPRS